MLNASSTAVDYARHANVVVTVVETVSAPFSIEYVNTSGPE